jgi:ribosome biogenesis GTPase A
MLDLIAEKRGAIKKGSLPDYARASRIVIDDFRSGRIGRISLERP